METPVDTAAPLTDPMAATRSDDAPPQKGRGAAFAVLLLVFAACGGAGYMYWLDARHYESTDDAFIDGHVSQVAPQISGRVIAVLVGDNQVVQPGQKLLLIDPREAQVRVEQAEAELAQARAQLAVAEATLAVRGADLAQASANIRAAEADASQAQSDDARYRAINPRAISRQQVDNANAALRGARARLEANQHAAGSMKAQLAVAAAQRDAAAAVVRGDEANLATAKLQLSYTTVVAPAAGRVTKRTVELGNYVTPGQALLAIVQPGLWVTANFKETQLTDMRPGQLVHIHVDAFPDQTLEGHVDSLQSGTGAVFSALPAENATGNYVKVVQRLPVKITLDGETAGTLPLAPGMSVTPRVAVR